MATMRSDNVFWVAVAIVTVSILAVSYFYVQKASLVEEIIELTRLQELQVQLLTQRVSVLLTVATLVLGGAGALVLHFWETRTFSLKHQRLAALSLLSGGLSIFFGYIAFDSAIWMLSAGFFNLGTTPVRVPSLLQLYSS